MNKRSNKNKPDINLLLKQIPDLFFITTQDGIIKNHSSCNYNLINNSVSELFPLTIKNYIEEKILSSAAENKIEKLFLSDLLIKFLPLVEDYIGVFITKSVEREKLNKLIKKNKSLAAAARISSYLAHEVKTSFTGIKLNLDYLKDSIKTIPRQEKSISILQSEIERINKLLKDILRIQGNKKIEMSDVNLNILIEKIRDFIQPSLMKRKIRFINKTGYYEVFGNEDYLHSVFLQLIENSIDSVEKGGTIELSSEVLHNKLKVYIKDTGNMIKFPDKIFDQFFTTKTKGSGLGLFIAKKIMKKHKGSVELESTKNGENIFSVTFNKFGTIDV